MDAVSVVSRDDSTFINVVSLAKIIWHNVHMAFNIIPSTNTVLQIFLGTG
jgi:hypothetical protein